MLVPLYSFLFLGGIYTAILEYYMDVYLGRYVFYDPFLW